MLCSGAPGTENTNKNRGELIKHGCKLRINSPKNRTSIWKSCLPCLGFETGDDWCSDAFCCLRRPHRLKSQDQVWGDRRKVFDLVCADYLLTLQILNFSAGFCLHELRWIWLNGIALEITWSNLGWELKS